MKALLGLVAVVVLAIGGFIAFIRFGAANGADEHTHLTRTVAAQVTGSSSESDFTASPSSGFRVAFRYEADGQWFASDGWVPERQWTPARTTVEVCVDPQDPAAHVVPTVPGGRCGDRNLGRNDEERAEPAAAP